MGLRDTWVKKIGTHRGAPRLFLDAAQAARAGFAPGEAFEVTVDGHRVVLTKQVDGSRTVSSRKKTLDVNGREVEQRLPVIDINSAELLKAFEGMDAVRVVVGEDRIYLLPLASEIKKRERFERLARKVASGEPLAIGSISHGGGILTHAIHQGLKDAGLQTTLAFANEIREDLIVHAIEANDAWVDDGQTRTAALVMPMQELAQDDWVMANLPLLEVLEMGLPCSGASKAGKSKRGLEKMEDHPEVGHLAFSALAILNKTQPVAVLFENVVPYADTASAQILRQQLRDMGYTTHEAILEGKDFGSLENRIRWFMVAVTRGVEFDFHQLAPAMRIVRRLGDILDPTIGPDDPRWSDFAYLKTKRERDVAKGNNFKMQTIGPEDTSVPVLRKGYHKGGSTDPLLRHPDNPELLRKLTGDEHGRAKGIPAHLGAGLSELQKHQMFGQGIVYEPPRAVGRRIAERLIEAVERGEAVFRDGEVAKRRERMTG